MSSKLDQAAKDAFGLSATATNASAAVTITAPSQATLITIYVTGVMFSASGIIAASVAATLSGVLGADGTAKTLTWQLPASAIAPLSLGLGPHPLKILPGTNAVLTLPALGPGITGTATLLYYFGTI